MSYHTPPRRSAARSSSRPRSLYSASPSPQSRMSYSSGLSSSTPYLNSSSGYGSYGSQYGGTSSGYGGLTLPSAYSSSRSYNTSPSYRSYIPPTTTSPLPPVRPRRSKSSSRAPGGGGGEGGGRMSRSGSTTSLNSLRSEATSEGYESGGDNISTSRSRVNSESSGTSRKLPNGESGEVDYKKLYEESQAELARMRDTLSKTEEELTQVKATYANKNSLSEQEKRERRTMERKLSEMEVELKELDQYKKENQRLKDENGALIRVISKLSK